MRWLVLDRGIPISDPAMLAAALRKPHLARHKHTPRKTRHWPPLARFHSTERGELLRWLESGASCSVTQPAPEVLGRPFAEHRSPSRVGQSSREVFCYDHYTRDGLQGR